MASSKQAEASRTNGAKSKGPRSQAGKAVASLNAVRHGLESARPVLPTEDPEAWDRHLAGVVLDLSPEGELERELAERAALILWRLRRVTRYETAVCAEAVAGLLDAHERPKPPPEPGLHRVILVAPGDDEARALAALRKNLCERRACDGQWAGADELLRTLATLPDDAPLKAEDVEGLLGDRVNGALGEPEEYYVTDATFFADVGVPPEHCKDPWRWQGWTAAHARRAVQIMCAEFKDEPAAVLARALAQRDEAEAEERAERDAILAEIDRLERTLARRRQAATDSAALPSGGGPLEKVLKYEAHLNRQLLSTLATLERLQARRQGEDVPVPASATVAVE